MKYDTIIFDFFGVISSEVSPFWLAQKIKNKNITEIKNKYVTPADKGDITESELLNNLSSISSEKPEDIKNDWMNLVVIDQEIISLIKELRSEYKIGLCTNASSEFIRRILKIYDIENIFNSIVVSSEVHLIKPEPEIYTLALKNLNSIPEKTIFIDDNPINIKGAEDIGIKGILFKNIDELRIELEKFN